MQSARIRKGESDAGSLVRRWGRRAITVPLYIVSWLAIVGGLPALIVIAAVADSVRRSSWAGARFILLLAFYLSCEVAGIAMSFVLWLAKVATGSSRDRFLEWNFDLQQWWAGSLFQAGRLLFSMNLEIEGADGLGTRSVHSLHSPCEPR